VWRAEFADWTRAGDVPEIAVRFAGPPPLPKKVAAIESSIGPDGSQKKNANSFGTMLTWIAVIAGIAIGGVVAKPIGKQIGNTLFGYFSEVGQDREALIESALVKVEDSIRPTLPKKIDQSTTLVAISHSKKRLRYDYVFDFGTDKMTVQLGADFRTLVQTKVCANMEKTLGYGVSYQYLYFDRQLNIVGDFVFTRADCKPNLMRTGTEPALDFSQFGTPVK